MHRLPALRDGLPRRAHQCIFTGPDDKVRPPHAHTPGVAKRPLTWQAGALAGDRVPWIDEPECVGCNLCQLVCPVPDCIEMVEEPTGVSETWNDRVAAGRGKIPGGIHDDGPAPKH